MLTLSQLEFHAPPGKRLVVLGDPVKHSLSPVMHNAALQEMAKSCPELSDWRYEAVHVRAEELGQALQKLHSEGVAGINLTIPHKVQVIGTLEDVDMVARRMGAANTLVRTETGYRGSNTDGYGILKGLEESFRRTVEGADIWLFGAGGAARGILVACLEAGARRLTVVNRSEERLLALRDSLAWEELGGSGKVRFHQLEDHPEDPDEDAILINATSLGLRAADRIPINASFLTPQRCVYDTTYGTLNRLAEACRFTGTAYADGLSMLVWQGAKSLQMWTGQPVPAAIMRSAAEEELSNRKSHG